MVLSVNTNNAALYAQSAQARTTDAMDTAMERLSTGKRINAAHDDAAGLAIATRMEAQIRGLDMAIKNSADAQALMNTAEGAQDEISNILQRMREISIQAGNDTNVAQDRVGLQTEINQLIAEMDRISSQTTWNGMSVLDGTFSTKKFQIGAEAGQNIELSLDSVASSVLGNYQLNTLVNLTSTAVGGILADSYTVVGAEGTATFSTSVGDSAKEFAADINSRTGSTGVSATAVTKLKLSGLTAAEAVFLKINGTSTATVAIGDTTDLRDLMDAINAKSGTTGVTASLYGGSNAALELVDADGDDIKIEMDAASTTTEMTLTALDRNGTTAQSGQATNLVATLIDAGGTAAAGYDTKVAVVTGQVSLSSYDAFNLTQVTDDAVGFGHGGNTSGYITADGEFIGAGTTNGTYTGNASLTTVSTVDVSTRSGAETALNVIDGALDKINNQRAKLGALANRITYTMNNLQNIQVNVQASQGRIQDADFAAETSALVRSQILSQAATAMLAQANASKQTVLTLLQG
ncbi:MAG: flagellin [Rhodospirillaceae bacterium]